jgi:hypothetical protein
MEVIIFMWGLAGVCVFIYLLTRYDARKKRARVLARYETLKDSVKSVSAIVFLVDGTRLTIEKTFTTELINRYYDGYYISKAENKAALFCHDLLACHTNGLTHKGVFFTPNAIHSVIIN